jgi:hypothetical protein
LLEDRGSFVLDGLMMRTSAFRDALQGLRAELVYRNRIHGIHLKTKLHRTTSTLKHHQYTRAFGPSSALPFADV